MNDTPSPESVETLNEFEFAEAESSHIWYRHKGRMTLREWDVNYACCVLESFLNAISPASEEYYVQNYFSIVNGKATIVIFRNEIRPRTLLPPTTTDEAIP